MRYFEEIDSWLDDLLFDFIRPSDSDDEEYIRIKKDICAKILESYRNGQKAGGQPDAPDKDERPRVDGARTFRPRWKRGGHQ